MEDTIAAVATAYGEGGIGIIRISGERARNILSLLFQPAANTEEAPIVNRRLVYGHVVSPSTGERVDEAMAVFMEAPATYTREDVAEIHCHGSVISLSKTLALALENGARLAEPGEFTKRAFLNGRIDLSQAEAVIDVVKAKTETGFSLALAQLEGTLSRRIRELRKGLMDLLVALAVNMDYPDEDIEELEYKVLEERISSIGDEIDRLRATADIGRLIREGLRVTIVGRPNVGKSSLMNALLGESRAIVTEIPGTTRDTIEEGIQIKGIPVYLTDTAGIRATEDTIERIGIEKSKDAVQRADLILFMIDASQPLRPEDIEIAEGIGERKVIVLLNKEDLGKKVSQKELDRILPHAVFIDTAVPLDKGIADLTEEIVSQVNRGNVRQENSLIVTNARQKALLDIASSLLLDALKMTRERAAMDFIETDVRHAWETLGDIIGETISDDIIDQVFARFCLGK
ncbi:MAG: tRNA uridine-5-carboxymethylaminomethyl(34) synthesis GTPase MnmE [Firmicutes bacterium HGW-Firmicutes-11]|jgi:tRNA modification GTPase|nr:MAG: tRNA uridine-5-carboxymethylaminomethyl(34) synthesis GTPase MnmE [Firmicutes bacterium HGW-Firmicutes-11]